MKKSNIVVLGLCVLVAAFLLFLWYFLGFNTIDTPFDLILAIAWFAGIVGIGALICYTEKKRKEQIRTIFVSPTMLYNCEKGIVGFKDADVVSAARDILAGLTYDFAKKNFPDSSTFKVQFVIRTSKFGQSRKSDNQPVWTGSVIVVDKKKGNTEVEFNNESELRNALKK